MATFTWTVTRMYCAQQIADKQDVVITAQWKCVGTDAPFTAEISGSATFSYDPASTFIPYNQLTEAQVLQWCWASGVDKDAIENDLGLVIARQKAEASAPVPVSPALPW